jgi:EpsI family protein
VAAVVLLAWARMLARLVAQRPPAAGPATAVAPAGRDRPLLRGVAFAFAVVALAGTAVGAHAARGRLGAPDTEAADAAQMQARFLALPRDVDAYRGEPRTWDERTVRASGADAYAAMRYADPEGRSYDLFLGGALRNDDNFHAPDVCMPTAGWETLSDEDVQLAAPALTARRLLLQKGAERMFVTYWFQAGDRPAADEWAVRFYRLLDLLRGRALTPTLIVSVYVPVAGDDADAAAASERFLVALAPHLRVASAAGDIHG